MPYLPFISDEKLLQYTNEVLMKASMAETEAEANIYSNVIDPFSALFDSMRRGISMETWLQQEKSRQIQKTLQNAVGDFHQNILGTMPGWENAGRGGSYDIRNKEKKLIAEIKNKHNTMNSSSAESAYQKLANHLRYSEQGYTAYIVFIIPRTPEAFDTPWSPNQTTMTLREDVRKIDGRSFYDLAANTKGALHSLYEQLPKVIAQSLNTKLGNVKKSPELTDLFSRAYK
jgi:hypothetical protein